MRIWRLAGLLVAFAMIAAACGDTASTTTVTEAPPATEAPATEAPATEAPATEAPPTTEAPVLPALQIWADDKFGLILPDIAAPFTEETGVPVEITVIDFGDMQEQIITAAPVGEGPDVFIGAHDWLGAMVENGIAAPLDLGAKTSSFTEVSLNALKFDGSQYAMPYAQEAIALFYNADLVTEPPATVAELTAICDDLGDAIDNCWGVQGGGVGGDAFHNFPFVSVKGGYIFGFDPDSGFDTSDVGIDSEGAIAGVTAMADLVADGYIDGIDEDDAKQLFLDSKEAFFMSGPWWINTWNDAGLNWGVTVLPTLEGDPMGPFVGVRGFYVSEFGENKAVAEEFLLSFIATDETMLSLFEADPRGPAWIPTIPATGDEFAPFAESASNGQFMPNIPEMGAVWGPLGDQLLAVRQGVATPADAMAAAAEQIRAAVAES